MDLLQLEDQDQATPVLPSAPVLLKASALGQVLVAAAVADLAQAVIQAAVQDQDLALAVALALAAAMAQAPALIQALVLPLGQALPLPAYPSAAAKAVPAPQLPQQLPHP